MPLSQLHDEIEVPEYATRIPWLITRSELATYVPAAFTTSSGGWPKLRFTLLGVTADYGFNFVSHPESKLLEVRFDEPDHEDIEEAFRATSAALREHLGNPNQVDHPEYHNLWWRDDHVWVHHSANVPEDPTAKRRHSLSVYYHTGVPRAWVDKSERTLTQVKRLLNLMPGVEVSQVWCRPGYTGLDLAVGSLPSLARLAHMACSANFRLQVGIDAYREANGGLARHDPAGILYRIEIRGPREPEPGGFVTTLQILGIELADDLREQGLLEEEEARRLIAKFNNHEE